MKIAEVYPTNFAIRLAVTAKLYDPLKAEGRLSPKKNAEDLHRRLVEFQQMVIGGVEIEDALCAYHGKALTKIQKKTLTLIHKTTLPWMKGHISGVLTEALEKTTNKNFMQAAELLLGEGGALGFTATEGGSGEIHLHFDKEDAKAWIIERMTKAGFVASVKRRLFSSITTKAVGFGNVGLTVA